MSDNFYYGYPLQASEDALSEAVNGREDVHRVDLDGAQSAYEYAMANPEDPRVYPNGYHTHGYGQAESNSYLIHQNQAPSRTAAHQNNGPQYGTSWAYGEQVDGPPPCEYIDPAQLTRPGSLQNELVGFNGYSDDNLYNGYHLDQSTSATAYADIQQDSRPSMYDSVGEPPNSHGSGIEDEILSETPFVTPTPIDTQSSHPSGGQSSVFIPGVLERQDNHCEVLEIYTDDLISHLDTIGTAHTHLRSNPMGKGQAAGGPMSSRFQYTVREGTPVVVDPNTSNSRSGVPSNDQLHLYVDSQYSGDVASPTSTATTADVLGCPFDECGSVFTGKWRKTNLNRHKRQKHAGQAVEYPCQDDNCTRIFQRKDARLKHYRKAHPYLNIGPAVLRRSLSSNGSDRVYTDHVQANPSQAFPYDS